MFSVREKSNLFPGSLHRFSNTLEDGGSWGQVFSPPDAIRSEVVANCWATQSSKTKWLQICCIQNKADMNKLACTNALFSHFPAAMDVIMNLRFLSLLGRKKQDVIKGPDVHFVHLFAKRISSLLLFSSGVRLKPLLRDWKSWRETWVPKSRSWRSESSV